MIRLAAQISDEEWDQLLDGLRAWLESLDPSSFHSPWAGLEIGQAQSDVWSELLEGVGEHVLFICLEPADGQATAHRMFGRTVNGQRRTGRDSRPPEASRESCRELEQTLWGETSRELRTFPSTLEEEIWRITVSNVDRSRSGDTAELPSGAKLEQEQRESEGKSRVSTHGAYAAPEGQGDEDGRRFEQVGRLAETLDDGNESWIVSRAVEAEISTEAWDDVRFLGWRIVHDAVRSFAGVMPADDLPITAPGGGVLVAVLPDAAVSPSAQDLFLRDLAESIDRSERELTVAALAESVAESMKSMDLHRQFVIVCHEDDLGDWAATYHVDESSAPVINAEDVCAEIDRRIPVDS